MLKELLPATAIAVETREDRLDVELFPEEERALGRAVERRRREFVTGRACAREALTRLGLPQTAVGSGCRGEPLWPPGVVGSITHCEGYRGSAVAWSSQVLTLGIDAERDVPLPDGVWEQVAHGHERGFRTPAAPGADTQGPHLDAVVFSAKEAVYKAWFPLATGSLGFEDIELTIDVTAGSFRARLLRAAPCVAGTCLKEMSGRWTAGGGVVVTAVAVPVALGEATGGSD